MDAQRCLHRALSAWVGLCVVGCSGEDATDAPAGTTGTTTNEVSTGAETSGEADSSGGATSSGMAETSSSSAGQSSDDSTATGEQPNPACDAAREALSLALEQASSEVDFTLLLRTDDGRAFAYERGMSTATTVYESASTSKWVTAQVILRLVDEGILSLDDTPQQYLPYWTSDEGSPLSSLTLGTLLTFTSGLEQEPLCINLAVAQFSNCVEQVYTDNLANPVAPVTEFHYGSAHMQVAGAMAVAASGEADWAGVFAAFQAATGLFEDASYDLPSAGNPRLAGGMHWTAEAYLAFLEAVYEGDILSSELREALPSDPIAGLEISASPADAAGLAWRYAFGHWIECAGEDCAAQQRVSSPGAYGAYPFIDRSMGLYGILARQGALGTFAQGYATHNEVAAEIEAWATCDEGP